MNAERGPDETDVFSRPVELDAVLAEYLRAVEAGE